jgi:hypothetical protein
MPWEPAIINVGHFSSRERLPWGHLGAASGLFRTMIARGSFHPDQWPQTAEEFPRTTPANKRSGD